VSTDERLDRLGLRHLKDKPEELKRALDEADKKYEEEVAAWREKMAAEEAKTKKQKESAPARPAPKSPPR
jgi:hypothetical protein